MSVFDCSGWEITRMTSGGGDSGATRFLRSCKLEIGLVAGGVEGSRIAGERLEGSIEWERVMGLGSVSGTPGPRKSIGGAIERALVD